MNNEKKEKNSMNTVIEAIVGVTIAVVLIVGLFFLSELSGDRSNDKKELSASANGNVINGESTGTDDSQSENPLIESGETWSDDEVAKLEEIDLNGLKDLVKGKSVSVVMLGTETCYWCVNQKPVLAHALYLYPKVKAVYLDVSTLDGEGEKYLASLDSQLESFETPTFISVKNGKVTKVDTGARGVKELKTMFEDMGAM